MENRLELSASGEAVFERSNVGLDWRRAIAKESHVRKSREEYIIRSLSCVATWILMMSNSTLHFIGNGEALSGVADTWVNCRLGGGYRCGIPIWAALAPVGIIMESDDVKI